LKTLKITICLSTLQRRGGVANYVNGIQYLFRESVTVALQGTYANGEFNCQFQQPRLKSLMDKMLKYMASVDQQFFPKNQLFGMEMSFLKACGKIYAFRDEKV
jgi:hypothetical protein